MALSSVPHMCTPNIQLPPQGYEHSIKQRKAAATREVTASSINPHAEHHICLLQMDPATSSLSAHPRKVLLSPRARDWEGFRQDFSLQCGKAAEQDANVFVHPLLRSTGTAIP